MKTIEIPGVDFPVSKICMGCAHMGGRLNPDESFAIMDRYFDHGGRFFNTAYAYGYGKSEETLGQWIRSRGVRDRVIITTKGGEDETAPRGIAMHAEDLLQDMDESLMRLKLDYVDFFEAHVDDEAIGVDEIIEAMEQMRKAGKLRYYGCSNWSAKRQREAAAYAKAHGYPGFVVDEIGFNLAGNNLTNLGANKWLDESLIALHEEHGTCVAAYSPLVSGVLSKLVRDGDTRNWHKFYLIWFDSPYTREVARRIGQIQAETGWSPTHIQLAWMLNHPYKFPTFLIIGASSPEQLDDSMKALEISLTPEMIRYLRPDRKEFPLNTVSFID